jgi:hypothetical protein
MEMLKVKAHVGHDGILNLSLPVGVNDVDCDVTISVRPSLNREEWLQFINETYGSLEDDELERLPQGTLEEREPIE